MTFIILEAQETRLQKIKEISAVYKVQFYTILKNLLHYVCVSIVQNHDVISLIFLFGIIKNYDFL